MDDLDVIDGQPAPRTSLDKVATLLDELAASGVAGPLAFAAPMLPLARGVLPTDPDDLDRLLLMGAKMCLELRSDEAWEPDTIDDLWLGPTPDSSSGDPDGEGA